MLYLLLTLFLAYISVITYVFAKGYFNDGIDYSSQSSSNAIHKHIQNNVICENKNQKNIYYQFSDIKIPTYNGQQQIQSLLVTPFGIFIFDTKKYKHKLHYSDLGFTIQNGNDKMAKVFISSHTHKPSIDSVYQLLPSIDSLKVHFKTVITSDVEFCAKQPKNIIQLEQLKSLFDSKPIIFSQTQIQFIVGQLLSLNNQKFQNQHSKIA